MLMLLWEAAMLHTSRLRSLPKKLVNILLHLLKSTDAGMPSVIQNLDQLFRSQVRVWCASWMQAQSKVADAFKANNLTLFPTVVELSGALKAATAPKEIWTALA
jgi:hypothetical protein